MYTLSELLTEIYEETGLDSTKKTRIISRLNDFQRQICASEKWTWLEETFNVTTIANTDTYDIGIDNLLIKTVYQTTGGNKYQPLVEVKSAHEWDSLKNAFHTSKSDYPQYFHIREGQLQIFPKSSTSSNTITILYLKRPLPMETEDYSTGTISVTNGSTTVTGSGTLWASNVNAGDKIRINERWYEIASITNNTSLVLTKKYQGATESGITGYKIGSCPIIPEDFQSVLWKMYCEEFYTKNPDKDKRAMYQQMRMETMENLKNFSSSKSTSNIFEMGKRTLLNPNYDKPITVTY